MSIANNILLVDYFTKCNIILNITSRQQKPNVGRMLTYLHPSNTKTHYTLKLLHLVQSDKYSSTARPQNSDNMLFRHMTGQTHK